MTGAERKALRAFPDRNIVIDMQEYIYGRSQERTAYVEGYNQAIEDTVKFLRENLDRYDEHIGLTKEEFIIELYMFINSEV